MLPPEETMLFLPVGPHSAKRRNGARSSDGPYQASMQQHPWADSNTTEANVRKIQTGRGGGREKTGEERFSTNTHLCSWSATGIYPDWNKGCKHRSVCALPSTPHQHTLHHVHTHAGEQRAHTHTHAVHTGLCKKEKKQRRWGREMINKWSIIWSSSAHRGISLTSRSHQTQNTVAQRHREWHHLKDARASEADFQSTL